MSETKGVYLTCDADSEGATGEYAKGGVTSQVGAFGRSKVDAAEEAEGAIIFFDTGSEDETRENAKHRVWLQYFANAGMVDALRECLEEVRTNHLNDLVVFCAAKERANDAEARLRELVRYYPGAGGGGSDGSD